MHHHLQHELREAALDGRDAFLEPRLIGRCELPRGVREGGFENIHAGSSVGELVYVRLSGNNPPGEQRSLELKIRNNDTPQRPDEAADYALEQLEALIRKFESEETAYTSLNLSMWSNRYGAYDDLARIKEWSAAGGLGIEEW